MLIETVSHEQFLSGYTTTQFVNEYYLPQSNKNKIRGNKNDRNRSKYGRKCMEGVGS